MVVNELLNQTQEIELGDHIAVLYEDENEIVDYLTSFIIASLLRNERCVYITGDDNSSQVIKNIHTTSTQLPISGDLLILSKSEAYSKDGHFDPDKMVELLKSLSENAVNDGFAGLSITGEISWVLDYDKGHDLIVEYEWKINEYVFKDFPISALCRYNVNKYQDEVIIHVIQLHPFIFWKGSLHENPFYIPSIGYKNKEISKYKVKTWLKNIHNFTRAKSKFRKTIREQEAAIEQLHDSMTNGIITGMFALLTSHDPYTHNHSNSVSDLAREFSDYLNLSESESIKLHYASKVHDIGKILIPKEILNKPSALTSEEYEEIKKHPIHGSKALEHISDLDEISEAIKHHHEKWDGAGYPSGLKGEEIPFMARIIALLDAYDAITSNRPYRKAYSSDYAIQEIKQHAGSQFDPILANKFINMLEIQL